MEKYYPIYRDIKDWAVLDEIVVHDFSEEERPIEMVEVLIGSLHYDYISITFHNHYERRTPIIRWMSKKQYEYLKKNEGTVIW